MEGFAQIAPQMKLCLVNIRFLPKKKCKVLLINLSQVSKFNHFNHLYMSSLLSSNCIVFHRNFPSKSPLLIVPWPEYLTAFISI